MLKLNGNYSDYTDETDENYPEGKAINASSSESFDGTPLLAEFMNDINGAHIAMYEKAYGNTTGIDGNPDTQKNSQFADAVAKYTDDKVKSHADERGLADGVHGATVEATPGQICTRDELGNVKVGTAVEDGDAINKSVFDNIVNDIMRFIVPVGSVKMYTGVNDPKYYLICDGRAVSRSTYSALYAVIGTKYGAGDGSTTFNLPDMRECVPVGAGTSTRTDIGTHDALELGKYRADSFASHSHSCSTTNTNHTHSGSTSDMNRNSYGSMVFHRSCIDVADGVFSLTDESWNGYEWESDLAKKRFEMHLNHEHDFTTGACNGENASVSHSHTIGSNGGTTTHGKQLAFNYIIKY